MTTLCLLATLLCPPFDWTGYDTVWLAADGVAMLLDTGSTLAVVRHGGWEKNPIYGTPHPPPEELYIADALELLGSYLLARTLAPTSRMVWQISVAVERGVAVRGNLRYGFGLSW